MMKGTCPGPFTYGLLLWLMTGLVAPTQVQEQHWCDLCKISHGYVADLCGNFVKYFLQGYQLDIGASNMNHLTSTQIQASLLQWAADLENSPECTFVRSITTTEKECCVGWEGDNCTVAICNPACQNNGSCITPDVCECLPDFTGLHCAESMIELSKSLKYCYVSDSCNSSTLGKALVTKDVCCSAGGDGWGIYNGDCHMCPQGTKVHLDDPDYNPDQPSGCNVTLVTRELWGARDPTNVTPLSQTNKYFIHHSRGSRCNYFIECMLMVHQMQIDHMDDNGWSDIGYNFLVGEDLRVYEGRGWDVQGQHASNWSSEAHGICFMGDFNRILPIQAALNTVQQLMECGVSQGFVSSVYTLHGHRDGVCTSCPGDALYNEISTWPNFGGELPGGCEDGLGPYLSS